MNTEKAGELTQMESIEELYKFSHCLIDEKKAIELLAPFGMDAKAHIRKYECDYNDPKGLHGYNKEEFLTGLSAFAVPNIIMKKLGVKYTGMSFNGRGSQFRAELDFISNHLKTLQKA